jgi:hypothetical protein
METWRRGILLACVCLALWAAKFAVLKPLITVQFVDFAEKQKDESKWTDEGQRLSGLELEDYIVEKIKDVRAPVSGPQWERFFAGVRAASEGATRDREWLGRIPADERKYQFLKKSLFFRPAETLLAEISGRLHAEGDRVYIALEKDGKTIYLEATYHVYTPDDFHFGSGFSRYPKPPARFLFPYRKYGLWIMLIGLAAYFFLPRRKKETNAIYYPSWRNVLGDFASFLLITPFFALPLLIVGGSVQAITQGWMFCLIFWPLAFIGVWLLRTMAWYAGYRIILQEDGLLLETGKKSAKVLFADMDHYRPLVLTAPRWLVWLSALAALSGRGAAQIGAAGRAFLLAGSSYSGLGVGLKDKSSIFFWVTDAMGTTALKNAGRMLKMLDKAGIRRKDEPETIRSVALPTGQDRTGKIVKQGSEKILWILAALPVLVMIIFLLIVMFGRAF